jgi:hypothetical protein
MAQGALQAPAAMAAGRAPIADSRRIGRIALLAAAAFGYAVILTPILFVCWRSFFSNEIVTFPPQGYTLRWFAHIFDQSNFVSGFITSLQVGIVAGPRQRIKLQCGDTIGGCLDLLIAGTSDQGFTIERSWRRFVRCHA